MNENIQKFLDEQGRIKVWPSKRDKRDLLLAYLAEKFEVGCDYKEPEVNAIIKEWHTFTDHTMLRRELSDAGFVNRENGGTRYWREENAMPAPSQPQPHTQPPAQPH
ncbi:hypothetical protein FACS18949_14730 [Clostridia bacterium]|nr:hypothetical protein FACS18949_14730 [Clostridia bacterium]